MKHERITEECQEMAALYAFGALTQREASAFDAHLQDGCEICNAEQNESERVVGLLNTSTPPVFPPDYLRDLLIARIAKEAQLSRVQSTVAQIIPFPEKAKTTAPLSPAPKTGPLRPLLPWAIAASLLIALTYCFISWRNDRSALQTAKNQMKVVTLAGQPVAPSSSANVYWDRQNRRWVVTADLPPAPDGKVYQLWFIKGDTKTSAGLIQSDAKGQGVTVLDVPSDIEIDAVAITLEPQGGSQQPTSEVYALGKTS